MLEKIKNSPIWPVLLQFRDVRFVGFVVFGVLVLLVSWSGVQVIETNFELEKQVSRLQQENQVAQLQNNNLKLQNKYFETAQYKELVARQQFNRGLPGEKLLLVPKSVALAHTKDLSQPVAQKAAPKSSKPTYQRNLEAWRNFFTHRPMTN
jgi:cell division protein FtsB